MDSEKSFEKKREKNNKNQVPAIGLHYLSKSHSQKESGLSINTPSLPQ